MQFMKKSLFLVLAALVFIPVRALAQDTTPPVKKKASEIRKITGCLQKGDGAHEYALTATDGSTWEIESKTLKLSPHVGHTVTVTGLVQHPELHKMKEDAKDELKEHGVTKDDKEHGHLSATKLNMVSESCQK